MTIIASFSTATSPALPMFWGGDQSTVSRIVKGTGQCTPRVALRIEEVSDRARYRKGLSSGRRATLNSHARLSDNTMETKA